MHSKPAQILSTRPTLFYPTQSNLSKTAQSGNTNCCISSSLSLYLISYLQLTLHNKAKRSFKISKYDGDFFCPPFYSCTTKTSMSSVKRHTSMQIPAELDWCWESNQVKPGQGLCVQFSFDGVEKEWQQYKTSVLKSTQLELFKVVFYAFIEFDDRCFRNIKYQQK